MHDINRYFTDHKCDLSATALIDVTGRTHDRELDLVTGEIYMAIVTMTSLSKHAIVIDCRTLPYRLVDGK